MQNEKEWTAILDFITLLRKVFNLKLKNYFWNFPFIIFGLWLTIQTKLQKANQRYRWGLLYAQSLNFYPKTDI